MNIKILSPLWGYEHLDLLSFLERIRAEGYDGIDTWIPTDKRNQHTLLDYLDRHEMYLVAHQHEASGSTFEKFRVSFSENLYKCAGFNPLQINSHTGRDHFSIQQFLDLIAVAGEFSAKTGITVTHETHRGRMGYSPQMTAELFDKNSDFLLTADFSHWTCVTESMLENFGDILKQAILRSRHIHARVGFEQGPQVPDPRAPEWQYAVSKFQGWWDEIISINRDLGTTIMPVTTEFGPVPYMPTIPFTGQPVADQFELNCFIKDILRRRYASVPEPDSVRR
jgi:sugar phosphate isomerase/epimerase